ncbi:15635_t:CDS:1, partial [Funneliformis mosseae]
GTDDWKKPCLIKSYQNDNSIISKDSKIKQGSYSKSLNDSLALSSSSDLSYCEKDQYFNTKR